MIKINNKELFNYQSIAGIDTTTCYYDNIILYNANSIPNIIISISPKYTQPAKIMRRKKHT